MWKNQERELTNRVMSLPLLVQLYDNVNTIHLFCVFFYFSSFLKIIIEFVGRNSLKLHKFNDNFKSWNDERMIYRTSHHNVILIILSLQVIAQSAGDS